MQDETMKVLEMVAKGAISAEEAETLLGAMETGNEFQMIVPASVSTTQPPPFTASPEKPDWAKFWLIPAVSGLFMASLGLGYTVLVFSGNIHWAWIFLTGLVLLCGCALVVAGWLMKTSSWLHIRVQDADDRITISLPLPLGWIGWTVKFARPFVPQLADFASDELLEALAETSSEGGFSLEVQESEGEFVQIYYG